MMVFFQKKPVVVKNGELLIYWLRVRVRLELLSEVVPLGKVPPSIQGNNWVLIP